MQKGVRILELCARRAVDEAALLEALADGRVAAYVTDFPSDALLGAKGVICTPHLGIHAGKRGELRRHGCRRETRDFLESGIIHSSVNLPSRGRRARQQAAPFLHP
ncbi:MAG: hypothetical protein ACLUN5_02755 [Oscillospiraceae bacterium]